METEQSLTLTRFWYDDACTVGRFSLPSGIHLFTIERPWLNNERGISCIPEGVYRCWPRRFFRGGYDAYEVIDVTGRSHILFHVANWAHDVRGCIGVGSGFDPGKRMVTASRIGFGKFMEEMEEEEFGLTITHIEAILT